MKQFEIERLTQEALDAFWDVIVDRFPDFETGELSPLASAALDTAATNAVTEWIANNVVSREGHANDN